MRESRKKTCFFPPNLQIPAEFAAICYRKTGYPDGSTFFQSEMLISLKSNPVFDEGKNNHVVCPWHFVIFNDAQCEL